MRHSLTVASLLVHSAAAFALLERTPSLQHVLQDVTQSALRPAACPGVTSPRLARCVHTRYARVVAWHTRYSSVASLQNAEASDIDVPASLVCAFAQHLLIDFVLLNVELR